MSDRWNNPDDWNWGRRRGRGGPPVFVAALLIALGVLLFLGNLGFLPTEDIWVFWPVFPLAAGVAHVLRPNRHPNALFWGIVLIVFSVGFLLSNLGLAHFRIDDGRFLVPLLLIFFGVVGLMKILSGGRPARPASRPPGIPFTPPNPWQGSSAPPPNFDFENSLHDFTFFGALKRKLETSAFAGGDLTSIFGNIEIDLRRTLISSPNKSATLSTTAVFGAIKVRVPPDWRVHVSGVAILGNFEDKTIPPSIGPAASTLVITGFAIFGAVEIVD